MQFIIEDMLHLIKKEGSKIKLIEHMNYQKYYTINIHFTQCIDDKGYGVNELRDMIDIMNAQTSELMTYIENGEEWFGIFPFTNGMKYSNLYNAISFGISDYWLRMLLQDELYFKIDE